MCVRACVCVYVCIRISENFPANTTLLFIFTYLDNNAHWDRGETSFEQLIGMYFFLCKYFRSSNLFIYLLYMKRGHLETKNSMKSLMDLKVK